jgi:O-antigen biosynthesis protein WbqP
LGATRECSGGHSAHGAGRMTRVFDVCFALLGLLFLSPLLLLLWVMAWFDNRAPMFRQQRVGRYQAPFVLVKFRTMRPDTVSVATHLADASAITPFGYVLRRTKLDELPQLWNVLLGDMSLVGPRPCLFNQRELISHRAALDVFSARPGITGLAQIQGIDMSTPELLAKTDAQMLASLTLPVYFRYIFLTVLGRGSGDRVRG